MPVSQAQQTETLSLKSAVDLLTSDQNDEEIVDQEEDDQEASNTPETELDAQSDDDYDEQTDEDSSEESEGDDGLDEDREQLEADDEEGSDGEDIVYDVVLPDGQTVSVPDDELVTGYLRKDDYTRKTTVLAEKARILDQQMDQSRTARDKYLAQAQELEQQLNANFALSDELLQSNPQEYMRRKEAFSRVQEERARLEQEGRQEAGARFQHYVEDQKQRLLSVIPEWNDQQVMVKEQAELRDFALEMGFSQEEVQRVVDHRDVVILRMAMAAKKGDQVKKTVAEKKVAKVKPRPKSSRQRPKPRYTRRVEQAQKNFTKAGRGKKAINAGVDLILAREDAAKAKQRRR